MEGNTKVNIFKFTVFCYFFKFNMSVEVNQNIVTPVSRKKWSCYFFPKLPYGFQGFSF
jgi:hypothetical protein